MNYHVKIGKLDVIMPRKDYDNLREAIALHERHGYQSGETRHENVIITECGEAYPQEARVNG